jgi:xylan 1,4-beta-xylosidase
LVLWVQNRHQEAFIHAFKMLHMMGNQRIPAIIDKADGLDGLATVSDRGAQILLWNYVAPKSDAVSGPISLEVKGFSSDRATVKRYLVDEYHSNAYTCWKKMGSPAEPTELQLQELKDSMELELVELNRSFQVDGGQLTVDTTLSPGSVSPIKIES